MQQDRHLLRSSFEQAKKFNSCVLLEGETKMRITYSLGRKNGSRAALDGKFF